MSKDTELKPCPYAWNLCCEMYRLQGQRCQDCKEIWEEERKENE